MKMFFTAMIQIREKVKAKNKRKSGISRRQILNIIKSLVQLKIEEKNQSTLKL